MKYSFTDRIRFSEVDERGMLSPYSLINYMQDCATFHGEEVGLGIDWIAEHKRTWVLADAQLKVYRYPKYATYIKVSTWASGFKRCIGHRQFTIETPEGERLASAKSDWVFMDMENYVPVTDSAETDEQARLYGIEPDNIEEDLGKRKIRLPKEMRQRQKFVIQESHLDTNHHVNNGQYILMSQSYLPADFSPAHLRMEYKRQALLGDVICPLVSEKDGVYTVSLNGEDGDPYFVGEFA